MTKKITVTAKITAGVHPKHGAIVQGQEYTIDEADFAPQLFEKRGTRDEERGTRKPEEPEGTNLTRKKKK